jgi:hypothetical protein
MRRVTIAVDGKPAEAEQLDFDTVKEPWAEYALEDGTRLRFRATANKIWRVVDRFSPTGEPMYVVNSTTVVVADVPPQLLGPGTEAGH